MNAIPSDSFSPADLFTHALLFISIPLSRGCCRLKGLKRSSDLRSVICGGKHAGSHPRLRTASLSLYSTGGWGGGGGAWGKMEEKTGFGTGTLSNLLFDFFIWAGKNNPGRNPHVSACASVCFLSSCKQPHRLL